MSWRLFKTYRRFALRASSQFKKVKKLGYLKDSNAAAHSVDTGIS